jgi:hypothetical protein
LPLGLPKQGLLEVFFQGTVFLPELEQIRLVPVGLKPSIAAPGQIEVDAALKPPMISPVASGSIASVSLSRLEQRQTKRLRRHHLETL